MNQAGIAIFLLVGMVGGVLVVLGLTYQPAQTVAARPVRSKRNGPLLTRQQKTWAVVGLGIGILLFAYTGWVIILIISPLAGLALPMYLSKGDAPQRIARLEALETWTRSLSGLTIAGAGLEQTLTASLPSAPEAIKVQVTSLVARLNARWPTRDALEAFARELDDPTADLIVMHLLLKEQARGPGLAEALDDLAGIIFEEVKVRRQIETDRAKPRTQVRIVAIATLVVLAALPFLGSYTAAYATPIGQVLLAIWIALFTLLLTWMRSISTGKPAPRLLVAPEEKGKR